MKTFLALTDLLLGVCLVLVACRSDRIDQTTPEVPRSETLLERQSGTSFAISWNSEAVALEKNDYPPLLSFLEQSGLVVTTASLADSLGMTTIEKAGGRVERFCLKFMLSCEEALGKLTLDSPDVSSCQCYRCWDPTIGSAGGIPAGVDCEPPYNRCDRPMVMTDAVPAQLAALFVDEKCRPKR